jgi:hypothetical protein
MINEVVHVSIINAISHLNQKNVAISHQIIAANQFVISCIPSHKPRSNNLLFLSVLSANSLSKIGSAIAFHIATKI